MRFELGLSRTCRTGILGAVILTTSLAAVAATNGFYVPSFRGTDGSAVAGWERFTVGLNGGGNAPDMPGSTASSARLTQTDVGGVVTGSGNIYNQDGISKFQISYSDLANLQYVVLQTRTVGAELDYSSFRMNIGGLSLIGATYTELDRQPFVGQGPGAIVTSAWTWDLTGVSLKAFTLVVNAGGPSLSFDSATLDVTSTPEPSTWALLLTGLGLGTFILRSRR